MKPLTDLDVGSLIGNYRPSSEILNGSRQRKKGRHIMGKTTGEKLSVKKKHA